MDPPFFHPNPHESRKPLSNVDAPFWSPVNRGLPGEAPHALVADGRGLFAIIRSRGIFSISY